MRNEKQKAKTETLLARDLLARGWTRSLIDQFAPVPDQTPHRRGGGHYCVYHKKRIEKLEARRDWQELQAKSVARRPAAEKGVATKTAQLRAVADAIPLNLSVPTDCIGEAIADYNGRSRERDSERRASSSDDQAFLRRITGNYLRHERCNYEYALARIKRRCGSGEVYFALRARFQEEIEVCLDKLFGDYPLASPTVQTDP